MSDDRTMVLERVIDAPVALIWQAWTDPAALPLWWGPDGFVIEGPTIDLQVGGVWSFVMIGPDGTRFPNHSVFTEITPERKLVFDHGDGQRVWFVATIELEDTAAGTLVTLRHLFPTKEFRDEVVDKYGAIEGGKQHLAKLEKYLQGHIRAN